MSKHGNSFGAGESGGYKAPEHKSSTLRGSFMDDGDSAGVSSGLSALSGFDSESAYVGEKVSEARNPLTGNPLGRTTENPIESGSVSSKGWKFDLC